MANTPACDPDSGARVTLILPDDLAETIRIEAVKRRLRPRDVVTERLRESYERDPVRSRAS